MSQGREALVGSLFLCESALQATKPPKPTSQQQLRVEGKKKTQSCVKKSQMNLTGKERNTYGYNCCI